MFFCPECKGKVILKIGTQKIPHFAHYRVTKCSRYENESGYHLAGKEKIYLWLKEMGLRPKLEPYKESIRQRPDICFIYQGIKVAVEYQCSIIPEQLIKKRTTVYQHNQYYPLWILGGNQFKRKNAEVVTLSNFHYAFLSIKNGQTSLPFYCSDSNRFIFLNELAPVTVQNAIASIRTKPLKQVKLTELFIPQPHTSFSIKAWQRELKSFKNTFSLSPKAFKDPFLQELYQNHLHITFLPPEIGLPVPSSPLIRTPPLIWQGFLYLDVLKPLSVGEVFSLNDSIKPLAKRIRRKHISIRELTLGTGDYTLPISEYLTLLANCHYLKQLDKNHYQVVRKLEHAGNMNDQKTIEDTFYHKYKTLIDISRMDYDFS